MTHNFALESSVNTRILLTENDYIQTKARVSQWEIIK